MRAVHARIFLSKDGPRSGKEWDAWVHIDVNFARFPMVGDFGEKDEAGAKKVIFLTHQKSNHEDLGSST